MSIAGSALRRVMREISDLQKNPPEGIRVQTNEDNMLDLVGLIEGPEGTPYAGGYFRVKFKFTEEFPAAPPKCWFVTKIFHPNVSSSGEICVNTLKKDWKSTYGIQHILVTVKCLLIYPNPESALDEEAGKLLLEDYDSYCQRARLITSVHARGRPKEFDTSAAKEQEDTDTSGSKAQTPTLVPPATTTTFTLPISATTRKSTSPAPPSITALPLTSSPSNKDSTTTTKERHNSPAPLSTADANVAKKPSPAATIGATPSIEMTANKAVKRTATVAAAGGGEKRKKALKRL